MPTLNVGGRSVTVDDSFLKLSPDQQNATVEEIAGSLGLNNSSASAPQAASPNQPQQAYSAPEGYFDAAVQGIPIVGPLLQKAGAAGAAAIQPLLGQNQGTTFGQRYDANLAELQNRSQQFHNENPISSTAAGVAGGVAATAPLMGIPAVADAVGFGGGPLAANIVKGASSGAAVGGLDALTRGTDPGSGAAWGAAFGGAAPAVAKVVGSAANAISNRVSKPLSTSNQAAVDNVSRSLQAEGLTTPEAVNAKLNGLGPEAMLLDAGPNLTQKGAVIAASPGQGQQILRSSVEGRAAGAADRIAGSVDQIMGPPVDLSKASQTIYQQAKAAAGPLYQEAYQVPLQPTPELDSVLSSPFGKQAVAKAAKLALSDQSGPPSSMFSQAAAPAAMPDRMTAEQFRNFQTAQNAGPAVDARGLHLVRQAFDDMINAAQRQGANNTVRTLLSNRSIVDDSLKSIPQFQQADSIFSDMSGIRSAMADGLKAFSNSQTPEDLSAALQGMSAAEQQAYLQGARSAVRNVMGTARNDAAAARGMFAKEFNQEKLRLLVGPDAADSILNRIGAEQTYANTTNRITGNSETAARVLGKADLEAAHGFPGFDQLYAFSGSHGIVRGAAVKLFKSTYDAITRGRQQDIETSIAKLLTAQGVDRAKTVETLMNHAIKADPSGKTNRLIAQAVARLPQASAAGDDRTNTQSRTALPSR